MKANNNIYLGVGNTSLTEELGAYYQDFTPAMYHFENETLGKLDDQGIPYLIEKNRKYYSVIAIIQYGLMKHDNFLKDNKNQQNKIDLLNCIKWLDDNSETLGDSIVWRNEKNFQYNLEKGWISAMYQGQAISLYLRAYQLFNNEAYLRTAEKAFKSLYIDVDDGGVQRIDQAGNLWLEEYPTTPPSYVLNGFIYGFLGILDLYRVSKNKEAKKMFDDCLKTVEENLSKYDKWYWSVYDQKKKQLVSFYYQKNVHIPLMKILFQLTKKSIFNHYAVKWEKQLNSRLCRSVVELMYRIQPRIRRFKS